ncbi:MAG: hypothetical protein ACOC1F_14390 [Myxococcota bacterium]
MRYPERAEKVALDLGQRVDSAIARYNAESVRVGGDLVDSARSMITAAGSSVALLEEDVGMRGLPTSALHPAAPR